MTGFGKCQNVSEQLPPDASCRAAFPAEIRRFAIRHRARSSCAERRKVLEAGHS